MEKEKTKEIRSGKRRKGEREFAKERKTNEPKCTNEPKRTEPTETNERNSGGAGELSVK